MSIYIYKYIYMVNVGNSQCHRHPQSENIFLVGGMQFPVMGWFMTLFYPHYMYSVYLICIHTHTHFTNTSGNKWRLPKCFVFQIAGKHHCGTETRIHTMLSSRISGVLVLIILNYFQDMGLQGK